MTLPPVPSLCEWSNEVMVGRVQRASRQRTVRALRSAQILLPDLGSAEPWRGICHSFARGGGVELELKPKLVCHGIHTV